MDKRIQRKAVIVTVVFFLVIGLLVVHHSSDNDDLSYNAGQQQVPWLGGKTWQGAVVAQGVGGTGKKAMISNVDQECTRKQHKLPSEETLRKMSLEGVSEVYHRHVNNLQILCPIKPIYAGMNAGWQVCATPLEGPSTTVYFISQTKDDVIATRFLKEIAADTRATTVQLPSSLVLKAMSESETETQSIETKPVYDMMKLTTIDIMLIHAGKESANIVHWLDTKRALMSVDQLIVKFESVGRTSSQGDYIRQIVLLARLHDDGFRIFYVSRDPEPKCIYKLNGRDVTGCYIIYMMRCKSTQPPILIPPTEQLNKMSPTNSALLYHSYSLSTQILCQDVVRVGDINDGGWEVCNDTDYRPSPNCLVYSFGIDKDWTFDEEVSRIYGCEVHSFDPSIGLKDHKHSEKVWFHDLGLSNADGKRGSWQMKTLDSIKKMLGHSDRVLDYVKMDIEESEWGAIGQMLTSGVLKNVRQLAVEFHSPNVTPGKHYLQKLEILNRLYNSGFRLFWAHPNQMRGNQRRLAGTNREVTVCYELYYLNARYSSK
ncbi:uncharacterized protein LOC117329445 [Pecten maximus]|uniref:uncharacterized protein LOC117329445 n=1 Tax=Pecten maximus TaxID=6579 RepID=UPI0014584EC1|nr:uncharacterized protein LOC117329445 [Pecten maximus]XP_033743288.1 uncharacterized protein LOC117329445 [Pecten maximus]